ncbi:hypothetical protein [Aquisphaera insulae]|uniref:hypothetical protein n=1 Tax=Aquisphaera insulae TaxID=2712864 RepID=UPI0013EDB542|nr:hypothetical protein [Aquisphaera insulae]
MIQKIRSLLLAERKTLLLVAVTSVASVGLTGGAIPAALRWWRGDSAAAPALDPRFVAIGRSYVPELGEAYSAAWEDGAKALEAGQGIGEALKVVGRSWEQGRAKLFDRLVTPELSKVIPDGKAESEIEDGDKEAMVRAWRGLAGGMKPRGRLSWPFGR